MKTLRFIFSSLQGWLWEMEHKKILTEGKMNSKRKDYVAFPRLLRTPLLRKHPLIIAERKACAPIPRNETGLVFFIGASQLSGPAVPENQ
jgi:hypothetical protein